MILRPPRSVWEAARLWHLPEARHFRELKLWSQEAIGSRLMSLGTARAVSRSVVAAAPVWLRACGPCRVKTASFRLDLANEVAPWADRSVRRSR